VNQPAICSCNRADNGIIKYSLEEYMEVENDFISSKPVAKVEEVIPEEMNITMKQVDTMSQDTKFEEILQWK
jgi:cell division protein FtsZ